MGFDRNVYRLYHMGVRCNYPRNRRSEAIMGNKGVSHELTHFLRVERENPPRSIPELESKPPKALEDVYELFWKATMFVSPSQRVENLSKIEFSFVLANTNGYTFGQRQEEYLKFAEYLEKCELKIIQQGLRGVYVANKTAVADSQKKAQVYHATAMMFRAMAWFVYEIYNNPHNIPSASETMSIKTGK